MGALWEQSLGAIRSDVSSSSAGRPAGRLVLRADLYFFKRPDTRLERAPPKAAHALPQVRLSGLTFRTVRLESLTY